MAPSRDDTRTLTPGSAVEIASPRAGETPSIEGYVIERELAAGGQGVVYLASQSATRRSVAIKVLKDAADAGRRRFEREIELIARLQHPDIISIFHSGRTKDGRDYFVMDYFPGTPLNLHARERGVGLRELLSLFARVCRAVEYAHQRGVIHRDIKPSNVLIAPDGQLRVLDFGLAKSLAQDASMQTATERLIGTLQYMSPEQARGEELDTRTDVYSLGIVLYELLTGRFPYPVVGPVMDVLKHVTETEPTSPSRAWSADSGVARGVAGRGATVRLPQRREGESPIDDELETIILKALAKDRARRYQSAGELARDIESYLAGEPIEAKRASRMYVMRTTLQRYRVAAGFTAALVSLAAVAVALLLRENAQKRAALEERDELARTNSAIRNRLGILDDRNASQRADAKRRLRDEMPDPDAIAELSRSDAERNPDSAEAWFRLARACWASGRAYEATRAYERALSLNPADKMARTELAYAYEESGYWDGALGQYLELERLEPEYTAWPENAAFAFRRLGRWREAIAHLEARAPSAVDADARDWYDHAIAWYCLLAPQDEGRDAARGLRLATELRRRATQDPELVDNTLALAHLRNGAADEAVRVIDELIRRERARATDYLVLTLAELSRERVSAARRAYETARAILATSDDVDPDDAQLLQEEIERALAAR